MSADILDPSELLRLGDPSPLADTPTAASQTGRDVYARVMYARSSPAPQPSRPSTRRLVGIAFAVLAALAVAAAVWSAARTVTQTSDIVCYEGLTLDSNRSGGNSSDVLEPEACESLWLEGILVNSAVAAPGTVPALLGCVDELGVLVVLPSQDRGLCGSLGLADFEPSSGVLPGTILDRSLAAAFSGGSCLTMRDAESVVRGLFEEQALSDWTIRRIAEPTSDRPCASYGLDSVKRYVALTPIPRLGAAD